MQLQSQVGVAAPTLECWLQGLGLGTGLELSSRRVPKTASQTDAKVVPGEEQTHADLDATHDLVRLAQAGDRAALERLCERYVPRVRNWARGRIPPWARGLNTTNDLMVETMSAAVQRVESFEPRCDGAFRALVWKILLGKVVDELRRAGRRPQQEELGEGQPHPGPSADDVLLVRERLWKTLEPLSEDERELLVAHRLMGHTHAEIAESVGAPSADSVRMRIARAIEKLAWPDRP